MTVTENENEATTEARELTYLGAFTEALRQVMADECERIGLCEYVVADGAARERAEALAAEISRFPQQCMRADRRSALASHGRSVRDGLRQEWEGSRGMVAAEGIEGARRFAAGKGRGGDFESI